MDISIIIPTCDGVSTLKRCLRMLGRQRVKYDSFSWEIIIVMDKKDRTTEQWFFTGSRRYSKVKLFRARGEGVNSARNKGIEEANGEILFFLDDDCVPAHKLWLNEVLLTFRLHRDADAIGGGYRCRDKFDICAISRNKLNNFYVQSNTSPSGETAVLLGGDCGYRREIFQSCGVFDDTMHYGSAEKEMQDRIRKNGGRMLCFEKLSIFHITPPKPISVYLIKSFKQGAGQAYSRIKNSSSSLPDGRTNQRFWFLTIANEFEGRLIDKFFIALFLLINSAFYFSGKIYGFIRHRLR
ncbi:MAG: glycosyltransferase family 2 protein [Candidatus Omnitrophica bacterium]|nr:glycosyltransferase family 2 protein [Candidatus Omnitrophota bacterium]MBU1925760.1 glycosyltransferase family 2 protein [Candidatus Omnitrophota bacterium]MBU2062844.1 glycosyltransferase family 2 protein [Candidatus Omnitrophota bacterium]